MSEIRNVYRVVGGVIGSMATGNTGANNASHIPGSPISGEHIYALSKMSDKIKELSYSISNYSSGKPFPLEKYGVFLVGYDDKAGVF